MGFGKKLAEYRKHSGVRQDEFAELLWMNRSHINQIEREKVNPPRFETILFMIGVLNLSPEAALDLLLEAMKSHGAGSMVTIERLTKSLEAFEAAANTMRATVPRLKGALNVAEQHLHVELTI